MDIDSVPGDLIMDSFDLNYQAALSKVEASIENMLDTMPTYTAIDINAIEKSASALDAWDYCYAIAIGLAGIFISTNEKFKQYLAGIHEAASGANGEYDIFQSFLGEKLLHKGDHIDAIESPFKNRNATNAYAIFHRLLWGHDVFSIGEDNPFYLMFKQKGISGILHATRHLLADTASKQGLPLPGSSFLDVVGEDGKTSNYLIKIAQQLSEETVGNKANAQEIYAHVATIRAQNVAAGVVVKAISELYFKIRKIEDNIRRTEILLIAYAVNFFGEAVVGCIRQKGVPYINVPIATAMGVTFVKFCYINNMEIEQLSSITDKLTAKTEILISEQEVLTNMLPKYSCANAYIQAIEGADKNLNELISFLGEADGVK